VKADLPPFHGPDRARRSVVRGTISSAGFEAGHRFVVGHWPVSPIGPMADVMWITGQDERILLVHRKDVADFITSIYEFDEIRVAPLSVQCDNRRLRVRGHGVELELLGGGRRPVPIRRPLAVTRFVEAPIARALMGTRTYGISPTGAREWYQTSGWRWVVGGSVTVDGRDLGPPRPIERPVGVGFSDPPRRPSMVSVKVTVELPKTAGQPSDSGPTWRMTSGTGTLEEQVQIPPITEAGHPMTTPAAPAVDIGISEDDRIAIAEGISKVLADTYTLYLKTHNYHWNVTGPLFNTLHLMFETQYNELWTAVDLLAERIRSLGVLAPGSYRQFSELTVIEEADGVPTAEGMIADLVAGHEAVTRTAREVLALADGAGDESTADLLTQRLQVHEKTAWMLRSMLE
jgi:starvation-inducible DNA-binding protein